MNAGLHAVDYRCKKRFNRPQMPQARKQNAAAAVPKRDRA